MSTSDVQQTNHSATVLDVKRRPNDYPTMSSGSNMYNSGGNEPAQLKTIHPPPLQHFSMDDSAATSSTTKTTRPTLLNDDTGPISAQRKGNMNGIARHTFGLILLLGVVFTWTASNFMGSVSSLKSRRRRKWRTN